MISLLAAAVLFTSGSQGGDGTLSGLDGETFNHILTPGEKSDLKMDVKAGDVAIFRVRSSVFDPGIEVTDPDGKVIGSNDDEANGIQDAFLLTYFPKDGQYSARVLNYRSNAGGPYTINVRRFSTVEVRPGTPLDVASTSRQRRFARIAATSGQTIVCRVSTNDVVEGVIGPDGRNVTNLDMVETVGKRRRLFRADADGFYYVPFQVGPAKAATFSASLAREFDCETDVQKPVPPLEPGGVDIWRSHLQANTFVRAQALSADYISLQPVVGGRVFGGYMGNTPITPFATASPKGKFRQFFSVRGNTDATFYVQQPGDKPIAYRFELGAGAQPWNPKDPLQSKLGLAQDEFLAIDAHAGDFLKIGAESDAFDAALALWDAQGTLIASNDDTSAANPNPSFALAVSRTQRYYLQVSSSGGGGQGAYSLHSSLLPTTRIALAKRTTIPKGEEFGMIIDFTAEKDQIYVISIRGADPVVSLYSPQGEVILPGQTQIDAKEELLTFKSTASGSYRLWFRGGAESVRIDALPQ